MSAEKEADWVPTSLMSRLQTSFDYFFVDHKAQVGESFPLFNIVVFPAFLENYQLIPDSSIFVSAYLEQDIKIIPILKSNNRF